MTTDFEDIDEQEKVKLVIEAVKKLNCIELTVNGYVFGGYIETVLNNKSPYLLKTNFNGDSLWTRIYEEKWLDS